MQLALDESTHDLIKPVGGGVSRVDKGRHTIQLVRCKLLTRLGEWALDTSLGWVAFEDYDRGYNLFDLEIRATEVILSCSGVQSVDEMTLKVAKRQLILSFKATTIYGEIDLTIPW